MCEENKLKLVFKNWFQFYLKSVNAFTQYFMFIECGKKNELVPGSSQEIKCKFCSGRIFYKVR